MFLALILLFSSSAVFAANKYICFSADDNEPYGIEKIELAVISDSAISLRMQAMKLVTEKYELDERYQPKSTSMKNYLKFDIVEPDYEAYGEGPVTPFYMESALINGGYPLRRGGMGGFIKTSGHGYSWASYLCLLQ